MGLSRRGRRRASLKVLDGELLAAHAASLLQTQLETGYLVQAEVKSESEVHVVAHYARWAGNG